MEQKMDKLEEKKNKVDLKGIKSFYITKGIFSFLEEKQKLNMIIYNKYFQKMFCVDVEYYKRISGKYKIGEKNGIGKECNLYTNKVIFEGEYLNGKKHGKGKEYYESCVLNYEGEYLNGERNGKGKEYNFNGKLVYEGEYLNGKRKIIWLLWYVIVYDK